MKPLYLICITYLFLIPVSLIAGFKGYEINKDSLKISTDSSRIVSDTTIKKSQDPSKIKQTDINDVIYYIAKDSAVFDVDNKKLYLYNQAKLNYKDLKLEAGQIMVDQETQTLEAIGIPDTSGSSKVIQSPKMAQGDDKYEGSYLTYNFKTQQGNVEKGFKEDEYGYYFGENIKKVSSDAIFVKNGLYTTSTERIDPEYFFLSPKMKVIPKDKVIAQSVLLYIEGVPVFWIPFAIFPNKKGRSSGLIAPTFGEDGTYGRYIARGGYFWAMNDYMDLALTGSYFLRGRFDGFARYRYALKYKFSGTIDAGYSRIRLGEEIDPDRNFSDAWSLRINHSQQFDPTMNLQGNLEFVSGKNYYNNSTNRLPDLLRQNIISNVTFSKSWENKPFSLSLNYYRDQNLQTGDINERLPSASFSISTNYPFRRNNVNENLKFYEYLSYSYNSFFLNNRIKQNVKTSSGTDSLVRDNKLGARHLLNINFNPQLQNFGFNAFFNYNENWYNKYITKAFNINDSTVSTVEVKGFKAVRYFNTGIELNTKLIGIFNPRLFKITGIKHTIIPSVRYNYQPDFSSDSYGYYGSYVDASGRIIKYSLFENSIFGGAPLGKISAVEFSLSNQFEMKTRVNDSTENKFRLFNINLGIGYNFAADSLKLSPLRADFSTELGGLLNITGNAEFNFYKFDNLSGQRINKFLAKEGRLADLTQFNINLSTDFNFDLSNQKRGFIQDTIHVDSLVTKRQQQVAYDDVVFNIPVSGSFNFNYSELRNDPRNISRNSNISANLIFNPTEKWRFTATASYDLIAHQINAPYITAYRDLKSWEMFFNWYPGGTFKGFNFVVRIKAPQLQDIKITKRGGESGIYEQGY